VVEDQLVLCHGFVSGVRQQARAATRDDNNNDDRVGTKE
jgi:hypothetical protein